MRICLVSYTYPPNSSGGGDIYAYNIVKGLKRLNHKVIVITSSNTPKKIQNGIYYIPIHKIPGYRIRDFLNKAKKFCINLWESKLIDIFHFNGPSGCALFRKDLPTVMTVHHSVLSTLKILTRYPSSLTTIDTLQECNPYNIWLESKSIKSVKQIIAVSNHTSSQLKGRGISTNKINVVHNGIEIFAPPSETEEKELRQKLGILDKKVILFVGRLDQRKGAIFLVKAMHNVKKIITDDFKCIIVGNGPQKKQIINFLNKNNIRSFFSFINQISYDNLRKIFFLCDLLVLPSLYEGLGLVLLEAMASKKPIIGTNSGGIPEIIRQGYNGYLTPLGSIEKLTDAINKILQNKTLAVKMGENGFKIVQKEFTWEKAVNETLKVYNKMLI
ncbi:MAG: glycosyltransferase family 4 protein [Candidatus Helarchaeota archaeon]